MITTLPPKVSLFFCSLIFIPTCFGQIRSESLKSIWNLLFFSLTSETLVTEYQIIIHLEDVTLTDDSTLSSNPLDTSLPIHKRSPSKIGRSDKGICSAMPPDDVDIIILNVPDSFSDIHLIARPWSASVSEP